MPFLTIYQDITELKVQAIVNAANSKLQRGGGVCGAIFRAAGSELQEECNTIGYCPTGSAVLTKGCNSKAEYIIHAVGPIWKGGNNGEEELLEQAYTTALNIAKQNKIKSIAFPLISAGVYGFPPAEARKIAVKAIGNFLRTSDMMVYLTIYTPKNFDYAANEIKRWLHHIRIRNNDLDINNTYKNYNIHTDTADSDYPSEFLADNNIDKLFAPKEPQLPASSRESIIELLNNTKKIKLQDIIYHLMDKKEITKNSAVYRSADISKQTFSKVICGTNKPSKNTMLALTIGLKLDLNEAEDFLSAAGYAFSQTDDRDTVVRAFIDDRNYNIYKLNDTLTYLNIEQLGEKVD